jgi:acyl-coenzyme A thioesterase PaaI-like protein
MRLFSKKFKDTLWVRFFGLRKIPMLLYVKPVVVELNERRCVIKIPFRRRTRNHLGSMYFGALSVGADLAGGIIAMRIISRSRDKISLIFKDFSARFLSRIESDAFFICEDGENIKKALEETITSKGRVNLPVTVKVKKSDSFESEALAECFLTLSLKALDHNR